ncbi:MAG TPA: hypothetical protein VE090_01295 [Methylomirabilota bacterium]|nr:hypothetical protein [Methylomirabilota bacterium]
MTFKIRLATAIATGAVLLNAIAPAAFAQDITVSQNGAHSDSSVTVSTNTSTVVNQTNTANVVNNVSSNSSTGSNKANNNTGGDVTVNTGSANTSVNVSNQLNTNSANVSGCGSCAGGGADVTISKNGTKSDNDVNLNTNGGTFVNQANNANVVNNVNAKSETGNNKANGNTGGTNGDVHVQSGNASTNVSVSTTANANVATVNGGNGSNGNSSVTISENGAHSDNDVNLHQNSAIVLDQANKSNIVNNVDADAFTGKNKANDNTGGDVTVQSGNANSNVDVRNMVNFNAADVDCGCLLDSLNVTVSKNGDKSDNDVNADSKTISSADQGNGAFLVNNIDGDAKTGDNKANDNGGDPLVKSGNINSSTDVNNTGNANLFDQGASQNVPGDWNFDFQFDLHGLFGFLHSWTV